MATDISEMIRLAMQKDSLLRGKTQGDITMAMIKCSECGKDISDKAAFCVGCGNPIASASKSIGDIDGDGKVGLGDVKAAFGKIKEKVMSAADVATERGKELLKSKQQKDAESVDLLVRKFGDEPSAPRTDSEQRCAAFKAALESTIDVKFAEIMRGKTDTEKFLTYVDGQVLTASVRNIFKSALSVTPPQIEAACTLSEAIIAPSSEERERLIKMAVGTGGGAAGIGMIIAGVGGALGWGAGVVASVSAFFVGTSLAGPIGWAIAGVTLAGVAAYFATTSNKHTDTERFLNVLKKSNSRAVDAIWVQYEPELSQVLNSEPAA